MNTPPVARIGIIGLGATGSAAARRLLASGLPDLALTVFDKVPAHCEPFRGSATLAVSAQEALLESDLLLLALPAAREIDRTLERFSDGQVGVEVRGKLLWNLRARPQAPAGLREAVEAAGADYVPDHAGAAQLEDLLRRRFDAARARAVVAAMLGA